MPLPTSEEIQLQPQNKKKVFFSGETVILKDKVPISLKETSFKPPLQPSKCYSQPMAKGCSSQKSPQPGIKMFRDKRFDSFKTWSGALERQLSVLRGKEPSGTSQDGKTPKRSFERALALPVDRYFDALEGPELETLRVCSFLFLSHVSYYMLKNRSPHHRIFSIHNYQVPTQTQILDTTLTRTRRHQF